MPQPPPAESNAIPLRVRASRLWLLCRQSKRSTPFYILATGLLCLLVRESVPTPLLVLWAFMVAVAIIVRMALFQAFRRLGPQELEILTWEWPFVLILMGEAAIWGLGAAAMMSHASPMHQVVLMAFLLGLAGGAYPLFAAHRQLLLATQTALLLPAALRLIWTGDPIGLGMAAAAALFGLSAVRSSRILASTLCESFQLSFELQEAKEAAEQLARLDPLTGLPNRRAMEEDGRLVASTCARHGHPLTAIAFDLDHFKRVNDSLGHAAGDAALCHVAHLLRSQLRSSDVFGRLGGEEFGILVSADQHEACALAEKLRLALLLSPAPFGEIMIPLSASFGVATGVESPEHLFQKADAALYQAKSEGRNCVVCHRCGRGRSIEDPSVLTCRRAELLESSVPAPCVPA